MAYFPNSNRQYPPGDGAAPSPGPGGFYVQPAQQLPSPHGLTPGYPLPSPGGSPQPYAPAPHAAAAAAAYNQSYPTGGYPPQQGTGAPGYPPPQHDHQPPYGAYGNQAQQRQPQYGGYPPPQNHGPGEAASYTGGGAPAGPDQATGAPGEKGLLGAVAGGAAGHLFGKKMGHGIIGAVAGAIGGSVLQDKMGHKKHKKDKKKKKHKHRSASGSGSSSSSSDSD